MKQLILKAGDLVKYHIESPRLNELGFVLGHFYKVRARQELIENTNSLGIIMLAEVSESMGGAILIDTSGELTEWSDHFSAHSCPVILPRGIEIANKYKLSN